MSETLLSEAERDQLLQKVRQLEEINKSSFFALTYLYEMALKLTEENKALRLKEE